MIRWTLSLPFYAILCQSSSVISGKMPLKDAMRRDLWGPIVVLLCFVIILWAARKKDATWVFFIWTAGSMVAHLVGRVAVEKSTLLAHMAIIGYATCPLPVVTLLILVVDPTSWVRVSLQVAAVGWAVIAALLAQQAVFRPSHRMSSFSAVAEASRSSATMEGKLSGKNTHLQLLFFPTLLTLIYLVSIV